MNADKHALAAKLRERIVDAGMVGIADALLLPADAAPHAPHPGRLTWREVLDSPVRARRLTICRACDEFDAGMCELEAVRMACRGCGPLFDEWLSNPASRCPLPQPRWPAEGPEG